MKKENKRLAHKTHKKISKNELKEFWKRVKYSHTAHLLLIFLILLSITPFIFAYFLQIKPAEHIEYGVSFSPRYATSLGLDWRETYIKILDELKIDNLRLVAYWDEIETSEGVYDFSQINWQIEEAQKRNAKVILVLGRKVPRWPECFEPDWIEGYSEKEIRNRLLLLLKEEVNNFKKYDNIKIWQVENEPFFPFGKCDLADSDFLKEEVALVRSLDSSRKIIIQDSGEGGVWYPTYKMGDYLGISMYRRVWFDFWGVFFRKNIFFKYPLSYWSYGLRARLVGVPREKIKVLELQTEPWGDKHTKLLTKAEKDKTMSRDKFLETISYAQKTGFGEIYFWGAEWWYYEKEVHKEPFFWETSKAFWR